MSWASGSEIFSEIIDVLIDADVDKSARQEIYQRLIEVFEDQDCDTLDECVGKDKAFDIIWQQHASEQHQEDLSDYDDDAGC